MKKLLGLVLAFVLVFPGCGKEQLTINDVPLLPKTAVLGNADRVAPQISPDGTKIAWLAGVQGVNNIIVAPIDSLKEQRVATKSVFPVHSFGWDYTNNLLYNVDTNGDENFHVWRATLDDEKSIDLTPGIGARSFVCYASRTHPTKVAVKTNDRVPEHFDVKLVDLDTGKQELIYQNTENINAIVDEDFNVRLGTRNTPDGGKELLRFRNSRWEVMEKVGFEDSKYVDFLTLDNSKRYVYMIDSQDMDTTVLSKVDVDSWQKEFLASDGMSDISDWIFSESGYDLAAVAFEYDMKRWQAIDDDFYRDISYLSGFRDDKFTVGSMSVDDNKWVVTYTGDTSAETYYLYDRSRGEATLLYSQRPKLENKRLARMHPRIIRSRDGIDLVCYLSLPPWMDSDEDGIPGKPMPMVLAVHGGPAQRDYWGFNSLHQLFANRGYAVLSVNFRGSRGFGKRFLNLGNGEWGRRMHDDLIDAVDWAVENGIAVPEKVAIYGGSYGGYAALAGLAFTPGKFACAIDIVGPSNLVTLLRTIPPYWKQHYESMKLQIGGDPETDEGRKSLESRSPLFFADKITKPLLIAHGANDPRVKVAESEQIVSAMKSKQIPVIFCYFPDEGHGFSKWENGNSFFILTEIFLSKHLGGRFEPYRQETFFDSSIEVKAGIDCFEGLRQMLSYPER